MSKKNKPIDPELIEEDDVDENWLQLKVGEDCSDTNGEFMKILSINLELSQIEFPRLFELSEEAMPNILKKIFIFGYNCFFPEPIIETTEDSQKIDEKLEKKVDILDGLINKLTGVSNNSKKIGIFGENYIQELITKNFIGMSYQQTGEIDHSGDGLITLSNGSEILVEIKNYSNIINDDEINKFTSDMKTTKRKFGLFISITTKINKMKIIDLKTFIHENETYYQFYISNLSEDLHRLEVGILVLQMLCEYNNTKVKEFTLDETIKDKLNILIEKLKMSNLYYV